MLPDKDHKNEYGHVEYAFLLNFVVLSIVLIFGIFLKKNFETRDEQNKSFILRCKKLLQKVW